MVKTYIMKKKVKTVMHQLHQYQQNEQLPLTLTNHICSVIVSILISSVVDRGSEPLCVQTKDCNIGICCFSSKHTALRRKSKDWLAQNENNVSEWSDMSTLGLLFR